MISTKGVQVEVANTSSNLPKYIKAGISEVMVSSVKGGTTPSGTPFLEFAFESPEGATNKSSYYFKEGMNAQISTQAVAQIADATDTRELIDNITASNYETYGEKLNTILMGKKFRGKFNGQEKIKRDGSGTWVEVKLGSGLFAESLTIKESDTKLYWSEEKNIKRLPKEAVQAITEGSSPAPKSDLPF
jgi:hypothetical protein